MARLRPMMMLQTPYFIDDATVPQEECEKRVSFLCELSGLKKVCHQDLTEVCLFHPSNQKVITIYNSTKSSISQGHALGYPFADCLECQYGYFASPTENKYTISVVARHPSNQRQWKIFEMVKGNIISGYLRRVKDASLTEAIVQIWREFLQQLDPNLQIEVSVKYSGEPTRFKPYVIPNTECDCGLPSNLSEQIDRKRLSSFFLNIEPHFNDY